MVAVAPDRGQFAGRLTAPFRVARVPGHAGVPSLYVMLPRQRGLLFVDAFGVGVKAYPDRDSEFNPPVSQRDSLAKMEVRSAPNDAYVTTRAMAPCSGLRSNMCSNASDDVLRTVARTPESPLF